MSNTEESRGASVLIEPLDQALPEAKDPVSFFCVSQQVPLFCFSFASLTYLRCLGAMCLQVKEKSSLENLLG